MLGCTNRVLPLADSLTQYTNRVCQILADVDDYLEDITEQLYSAADRGLFQTDIEISRKFFEDCGLYLLEKLEEAGYDVSVDPSSEVNDFSDSVIIYISWED